MSDRKSERQPERKREEECGTSAAEIARSDCH